MNPLRLVCMILVVPLASCDGKSPERSDPPAKMAAAEVKKQSAEEQQKQATPDKKDNAWPPKDLHKSEFRSYFRDDVNYVIDWGWAHANEDERARLRLWAARVHASALGVAVGWLAELMRSASRDVSVELRAFCQDEYGDGSYAITAKAGEVTFVVNPGRDDAVRKALEKSEYSKLFPVSIQAADYRAAGVETVETVLFLPKWVLSEMRAEARQEDTSWSRALQRSWKDARRVLASNAGALIASAREAKKSKERGSRKQTVRFGLDMYEDIEAFAEENDISRSLAITVAWLNRE